MEKRKPLCTVGGNGNWCTHYRNVTLSGFPDASVDKESTCNAGDLGSNPGLGRSSGEGNGNPLQYSCLENSMDEPGGLQSMGSQRVRHDKVTFTFSFSP